MRERLLANLNTYLGSEYEANLMGVIVDKVIALVRLYRNYPSSMSETLITTDLERYEAKIFDICLAKFSKVGVEGEHQHKENNVENWFDEDETLFNFITPYARLV